MSLHTATQKLFIEKILVSGTGEFGHVLLVHALYHRLWEVGDYYGRPLSFWKPTASKQPGDTLIPSESVWLPGVVAYSAWRNSACDCLDILHCAANSTIAHAVGLEHPTVLHLHAARVILLAPFRELRSFATSLATGRIHWQGHDSIEWRKIQHWLTHDQFKARLSMVHAGVSLWHARRYSTDAFHEPSAVFLGTLVLWSYGLFLSRTTAGQEDHEHPRPERPKVFFRPDSIVLDRPCDDELVQLFVRDGQSIKPTMTGAGDISEPNGPEKVLRAGCEILSGLTAWGISNKYRAVLGRLVALSEQNAAAANTWMPSS